jgi:hypothetical protein
MNCEGLLHRLGFECRMVKNNAIAVSTPFAFADGEPIGFYLIDTGDSVAISDNADTLAHLAGVGMDVADKRTWRGVKQATEDHGLELRDSGEIAGKADKAGETYLITRYISAILSIVEQEREMLGLTEEQSQYIAEVEMYLRATTKSPLIVLPQVKGHSGRTHQFHFQRDGELVEAARPHGGRTGSILRKSLDVLNAGEVKKILVVMDDRENAELAKAETDILSTSVSVIPFSRLMAQAGADTRPQ